MTKSKILKSILTTFTLALSAFLLASCATTKTSKDIAQPEFEDGLYVSPEEAQELADLESEVKAPEMTDTFLGDFNAISLKETICLMKSGKKMRPKELSKTFLIPRSNKIEIHFRDVANQVCIILDKAERDKITEAANQFLQEYETKTLHRDKVNRKSAYYVSKNAGVYFGISGYSNGTDHCEYYTNSEIFDKHAYFLINFISSRTEQGSGFTPKTKLYFSPTQLRDFLEILDQSYLNSQVEDLRKRAYTY